jgi:hypothetical protein
MENLLDKIYSETAEQKYENKEMKKDVVADFSSFVSQNDYIIDSNIDLESLENVKFSIENNE